MAIKAGALVHVGNGQTVIDRIQTGGPGQLNIPTEKINELGNYKSVATVRDVPDLTFSLESFDVSTEVETLMTRAYAGRGVTDAVTLLADATLTSATAAFTSADVGRMVIVDGAGVDGGEFVSTIATVTNGTTVEMTHAADTAGVALALRIVPNGINLNECVPQDFASQFKAGLQATDSTLVTASVAIPFIYLEQMSYRFGIRDNATQSASLRGDSIFYNPGACYIEETAGTNTVDQEVDTDFAAFQLADGDERRVLAVTVGSKRLTFGVDYVETYGSISGGAAVTTVTLAAAVPTTENIRIIYSSPNALQYAQAVHPLAAVKPAAVKGIDIDIYVGGYDPNDVAGSQTNRLLRVQSFQTDWRVQLEKDEEFGNRFAVGQDFDVPQVNGTLSLKPADPDELMSLLRNLLGVADPLKVMGPQSSEPVELDLVIKHPESGTPLKRLHIPDARCTMPGFQGRVQQKLTIEVPFESDSGDLLVFER